MRATLLALGLAAVFCGCSKAPTAPTVSDLYAPLYGTWGSYVVESGLGVQHSVRDSVRITFSPGNPHPEIHLWMLMLEAADLGQPPYAAYPGATWHELQITAPGSWDAVNLVLPDLATAPDTLTYHPACVWFIQLAPGAAPEYIEVDPYWAGATYTDGNARLYR